MLGRLHRCGCCFCRPIYMQALALGYSSIFSRSRRHISSPQSPCSQNGTPPISFFRVVGARDMLHSSVNLDDIYTEVLSWMSLAIILGVVIFLLKIGHTWCRSDLLIRASYSAFHLWRIEIGSYISRNFEGSWEYVYLLGRWYHISICG